MQRVFVWDLPTRLFHWLLVFAIAVSVITGQIGGAWIDWHGRSGIAIVGLVVFRLAWGVVGSRTARFAQFVRGPRTIRDYLRGQWQGIGHNPLGALSVLALLGVVALQVGTGLFTNDDITYQGPLADLISKELSDRLRAWHGWLFYALAGLIVLHFAAIVFHVRIKRERLIRPMVTGWKELPAAAPLPATEPVRLALHVGSLLLALGLSGLAVYAATGGFLPPPPPPAATPAPAW
ncbi:cytochrome B [Solimonas sp. K1W22B-7]|uniref:cytochrome b/b6 domain-containing protein n=1 Tax=Solimonas sp. K1W22B-7 TaxID=2303331 RepID=UPI000E334D01|nr:cytochrome b/b6 domain-containing protein [Solimonas sp. K1W22B-7]AXQ28467.1 cytochrome B [Solimonas sp. K1W22B-7]